MELHEIQARTFFNILKQGDTSLLGVKDHAKEFEIIYDKYFTEHDNQKDKQNLQNLLQISKYRLKLSYIDTLLEAIKLPRDMQHYELINNCLEAIGLKYKADDDNIVEVLKQQAGIIWNELQILNAETKAESKGDVTYSFSDIIVSFENVLERSIPDDINLEKFISYQKTCKKITDKRKQQ